MKLYRYEYSRNTTGFTLLLKTYTIINETSKGYWIKYYSDILDFPVQNKQWMKKNAIRPFAHETKEEALNEFIKRKKRQLCILKTKIKEVEQITNTAQRRYSNENKNLGCM